MGRSRAGGLSEVELNRYARQVVLADIGVEGQERIRRASVLVAGAGGLGTPILMQMAAMGVGRIKLIDRDVVSVTDLHRQYLYDESDAGMPKAEVARSKLKKMNPAVDVEALSETITYDGLLGQLEGVDVVLDGLDAMGPRYMLNRAAQRRGVPYVFSSAVEMFGNVSTILPGRTPCLECFYGGLEDDALPKCAVVGVHPSVLGTVASISVSEAVKLIVGRPPSLASKLLFVDLRSLSFDLVSLSKNRACPVCGEGEPQPEPKVRTIEQACARDGSGTYFVNPRRRLDLDLRKVDIYARRMGYILKARGRAMRSVKVDDIYEFTILKSGVGVFKVRKAVPDIDGARRRIGEIFRGLVEEGLGVGWKDSYEG